MKDTNEIIDIKKDLENTYNESQKLHEKEAKNA